MDKETARNIKLGIFVFCGIAFLVISLYFIGDKKKLFGDTLKISARVYNAEGLVVGNNIRLMGITIGTVDEIEIINDSLVGISMIIDNSATKFIRKNSLVSIGTDGLMGNKLVKIDPINQLSEGVQDGDILLSKRAIETTEMLQTLYATNENVHTISKDLKEISHRLTNANSFWNLLSDTILRNNLKNTATNITKTSEFTSSMASNLNYLVGDLRNGKGAFGALLSDSLVSKDLLSSIKDFKEISNDLTKISNELSLVTGKINNGNGAIGVLLNDTSFANNLNKTVLNLNAASSTFSENMEALKHNFLFKRYYKKKKE